MKKLLCICFIFSFVLSLPAVPGRAAASAEPLMLQAEAFELSGAQTEIIEFTLAESGEYRLELEYLPSQGASSPPMLGVSFDRPYSQGSDKSHALSRIYSYSYEKGRFMQDDYGNELIPDQIELELWQAAALTPDDGAGYSLHQGTHRLYLTGLGGSLSIRSLHLTPAKAPKSYSRYLSEQPAVQAPEYRHKQEAELPYQKSDLNISVTYDRSTPNISPNSPTAIRYNLLGGSSFSKEGQWVSWMFDVPAEGWYAFDLYYRQNIINGMAVHRRVLLNDELLFEELGDMVFPSTKAITSKTLGNDEGDFAFYLKKGTCKLTLEVTLEPVEDVIAELKKAITELNGISNQINVIVGETVDLLRDYDLDRSIPGLADALYENARLLQGTSQVLGGAGTGAGEYAARVNETIRVLEKMADKPKEIPRNLSYFRSQITTLSNILGALETQPLELDYFILRSAELPVEEANTHGFWSVVKFRLDSFLNSFLQDYQNIGGGGGNRLNVWVCNGSGFSVGREHAQIVNELILDSYSKETGHYANVSLVGSDVLIQAIASGKGPDLALFVAKEIIANLYYRDALLPLSEMDNFESVKSRFSPSSLIALERDGQLYALPETQAFQMLFYRKDIFAQAGLTVPDTWTDFYQTVKQMQVEQMKVGIAESPQTFEMFLLQQGSPFYNEALTKTTLTTQTAVEAFTKWTELYNTYKLPVSFDSLNRFRSGEMPLVITSIGFYSQLSVAAPEIRGLWGMAPIPATESAGVKNRAQTASVSGGIIVKNSKTEDYRAQLDFLNWWTSTEIQNRFARASEVRIGISSRYYPANQETLKAVFWSEEERAMISEQWSAVWDIPQTPASYFVQRNLTNAFRRVVYSQESPRDVIYRYGREVDNELTRKREELGLEGQS